MRVLVFMSVLGLFMLTSCYYQNNATAPKSAQNPPLYPDARAVQTQMVPNDKPKPTRVITFETSARPDAVMAYYKDALTRDGWGVESSQSKSETHFYWVDGCPVFGMTISTTLNVDGQTAVRLVLDETPCH